MSLAAANVVPTFHLRRKLVADDLLRLDDPAVIFEGDWRDSDGVPVYAYSVAGILDGERLQDGCTVGGEVMLIHADTREEADAIACMGLQDTIDALGRAESQMLDAAAALGRLGQVGHMGRMEAALKPASDMSDQFVRDAAAIRPLIGDDIVLTTGGASDSSTN